MNFDLDFDSNLRPIDVNKCREEMREFVVDVDNTTEALDCLEVMIETANNSINKFKKASERVESKLNDFLENL